jgi:LacI family transcriptional regulator
MDRVPKNAAVDAVLVDNVGGSRDCVSHLLDSGFKRIAMIGGPQTLETARQRLHGYKEGLRIGGMSLDRNLVVESNFRENGGFEAAIKLFRLKPRVDAIFVANGMMAIGVLHAMRKEGVRCPDDVGLVTFDDLPFSDAFQPSLTCIYQPAFEVGRLGTELLIERIEGLSVNGKPRVIQLSTELRVRESSVKRS